MMIKIKVVNDEILNGELFISSLMDLAKGITKSLYLKIEEGSDLRRLNFFNKDIIGYLNEFCERYQIQKNTITIEHDNLVQDKSAWPTYVKNFNADPMLYGQHLNFLSNKIVKKKFGIFISNSRWHRLWLASYLHYSYKEDLLISYRQQHTGKNPANLYIDQLMLKLSGRNDKDCLERVNEFCKHLPLLLETTNESADSLINFDRAYKILSYYNDIFIDVVCETYHEGDCFLPTEKIGRCFASKTPFIVYGGRNYLRNLKKLGFKTFEGIINESYDFHEGATRLFEMSKVIDNLSTKSLEQLTVLYQQMQGILEHNYKIYISLDKKKILDTFDV